MILGNEFVQEASDTMLAFHGHATFCRNHSGVSLEFEDAGSAGDREVPVLTGNDRPWPPFFAPICRTPGKNKTTDID